MRLCSYAVASIGYLLACMGGCFGCCNKTPLITTVDEPSQGLRIQGRTVKSLNKSEDLWSSSTCDMDSNAIPSQVSASSISTSNQTLDPHSSSSTASQPPEFVNHGLLLWNQIRQQWIGTKKTHKETQVREPVLSWNATYESLLGTSKPFPQPIPLPEMVDFLVEVWEQEGLYD
uniref:Gag1-like clamp domain-containing protein n=1 Tax=Kalanchoe fedtschenkoi TaxID=63787 RepID=A0A7N0URR9_KALFE